MITGFLALIIRGMRHRPVRSWLTILGIVIGIMLVVIIFALGSGIQNVVGKTLQMFGSDLIFVYPGKETNPIIGFLTGSQFRQRDIEELQNISGVTLVVPIDVATLTSEYLGEKQAVVAHGAPIVGLSTVFEQSQGVKILVGRWPTNDQDDEVVIGYLTARELFKEPIRVGDSLIIKSKRLRVSGILDRMGTDDDKALYLSLFNLHNLTGRTGVVTAIVKARPGTDLNLIAQQIRVQLSRQEVVRDFSVLTPEKASRLIGTVLSTIEVVLMIIALISLLVGAVGIMNTMYTSVLERTKQIGIMKAIGASREAILSLFLIESGLIGLIGGILGLAFGLGVAFVAGMGATQFGIQGLFSLGELDFFGLFSLIIFTFIVGVVSGVLPARQAASLEPADALRYE